MTNTEDNTDLTAIPLLDIDLATPRDLCYLCPPGTPEAHAESYCRHCMRPVCTKHNPGEQVGPALYDACPVCLAKQCGLANQSIFL